MNCIPVLTGRVPGEWSCEMCGFTDIDKVGHFPNKIYRPCPVGIDRKGPTWLARIANFSVALVKHIAGGGGTCSQEEIDARLEKCKVCPFFNGMICTHRKCGCNASDQATFFNKLAWPTESCPIGRWGASKESKS